MEGTVLAVGEPARRRAGLVIMASLALAAALAVPLLGERPTAWRLSWAALAVVGVGVMVTAPGAALNPVGAVAGLAATASMALGTVLSKRWGRPTGPAAYAGWQLSAGGLVIVPLAVLIEGAPPHLDTAAVAGYTWLSLIGAALAFTLWFRGVGHLPVGAVAFLPLTSPLVAAVLGWAVLGEDLTPIQGAGFTLALLAVASAQHTPTRHNPPTIITPSPPAPQPRSHRCPTHP